MPVTARIEARPLVCATAVLALALSATGRLVSASEQPPAPRPGADTAASSGPVVRLTADEAVRMALENNLGVQAERLGPEISTLAIAQARAAYSPTLVSTTTTRSSTQPPTSFLTGGVTTQVITNESFRATGGMAQNIPWGGGRYEFALDGSRIKTNAFSSYNPQLGSNLQASFVQPLLRDFRIDALRQQLQTTRNDQVVADLRLREQITLTAQAVRNAYYDLLGAMEGYKVARQSLDLSLESLRNNQTRVEVGTMAPIDIIEAEAEVASNEEAVIAAEARIRTVEDRLRALVLNPNQSDFWSVRLEPSESPAVVPMAIDVEAAVANAMANRTDLARARKQIENADVAVRYAENQKLPGLDVIASYNLIGLAGTQIQYGEGFPPAIVRETQRGFGGALRDVFGQQFRTWTVGMQFSYPIGASQAEAAAASARLQRQQGTASLRDMELQVATAVRDAARQVNTNLKRVEATGKARDRAERRLEAEHKRMNAGLSTTFQLFQAQRDLARQRQQEVNAMIDYNRSLVSFEAVQIAPVR
jgi:outer membrane protein